MQILLLRFPKLFQMKQVIPAVCAEEKLHGNSVYGATLENRS